MRLKRHLFYARMFALLKNACLKSKIRKTTFKKQSLIPSKIGIPLKNAVSADTKKIKNMAKGNCSCKNSDKNKRRKMRRLFTIKDFLRIAIYVNRDAKIPPLGLIAELAHQFGYGSMFGLASRTLTDSNKAMSQLRQVLSVIASAKLLQFLLMLRSTPLIMLPWVSTILSFVILFGTFLRKGVKALDFFSDNEHVARVAADLMECNDYLVTNHGQSDNAEDYPEGDLLDAIEEFVSAEVESFNNKAEIVKTLYDFYNFIHSTNIEPPATL